MTTVRESRTEKRATFEPAQRIVLLEQDADSFEGTVRAIETQLSKLLWIGIAGLVSFATAVVLLAIDIATRLS